MLETLNYYDLLSVKELQIFKNFIPPYSERGGGNYEKSMFLAEPQQA